MAELNPLGSEKLQGDAKIKRILELAYYNSNNEASSLITRSDFITETKNGVYGIVKEKDGYYVKKGLTENTLDYIGGLFMKNKNKFHSYAEAYKKLELLIGQENIQEDTRYVLNQNKPKPADEGVPPAPSLDSVPPAPNAGTPPPDGAGAPPDNELGDIPQDDEDGDNSDEMGNDSGFDESNPLKLQQKLAGKLGKSLRDVEDRLKPEDVKYFINSVLSALPLDKLEDTDKEEIVSKFEDTDDDQYGGDADKGGDDGIPPPEDDGSEYDPNASPEGDMGEGMDALEHLINTDFEQEEDEDFSGTGFGKREKYWNEDDYGTTPLHEDGEFEEDYDYGEGENDKNKSDYYEEDTQLDTDEECEHCGYMYGHKKGCPNHPDNFHDDLDEDNEFGDDDSEFDGDEFGKDDFNQNNPKVHSIHNPDTYPAEDDSDFDEPYDDQKTPSFDLNEVTNMINKSVKENLRKYFK